MPRLLELEQEPPGFEPQAGWLQNLRFNTGQFCLGCIPSHEQNKLDNIIGESVTDENDVFTKATKIFKEIRHKANKRYASLSSFLWRKCWFPPSRLMASGEDGERRWTGLQLQQADHFLDFKQEAPARSTKNLLIKFFPGVRLFRTTVDSGLFFQNSTRGFPSFQRVRRVVSSAGSIAQMS